MSSSSSSSSHLANNKVKAYLAQSLGSAFEAGEVGRRDVREHDVSIKVLYCGICHTDIHMWRNEWGNAHYPLVPGHEIVGVVESIGAGVTKFKVGQNVGVGCIVNTCNECHFCTHDLEPHCAKGMTMTYSDPDKISGGFTYGGYSERIVVEDRYVISIPDGLPLDQAAPLLCAGITVYTPLKRANIGPEKTVGVVGIGGLGHMALKLGHALKANVIAFTSNANKKDDLLALGANQVVVTSDQEALKALAGTVDLIIDTVSAPHDVAPFINALVFEGMYNVVGAPPAPFQVPGVPLLFKRISFTGSGIGGIPSTQELINFCAEHKIGAQIEVMPLSEVNKALERLEKGDVRYRFVLDVGGAFGN